MVRHFSKVPYSGPKSFREGDKYSSQEIAERIPDIPQCHVTEEGNDGLENGMQE